MAEVAAHLSDSVLPAVPVRQWVLSVPKRLRPQLMRDADLASAVLRILLRVIRGELRDSVRGPLPSDARLGAVSFLHRFGSGLNPHPPFHYHGVFAPKATWRREATRYGREAAEKASPGSQPEGTTAAPGSACDHGPDRGPRRRWAQLLARVYEIDPLRCPSCHRQMRILDPEVVRPILRHLRIPEQPPPVRPARGPPQTELLAVDPPSPWDHCGHATTGRDPFDQSLPGDDGTWSA